MVATAPHVLVVPKRVEANSLAELLKMARANPGKMNYASAGIGTTFHFCAEMFKDETGTNIVHVPYKGGGPALVDTLSGVVDMSFPTLSAVLPHVKAGNLKALAVTSSTRAKLLPEIPTMQEAGVKGFEFTQWLAILAPAGTPQPVVAKLNQALNAALGSKELADKFSQQGFEPFATSPEESRKFLANEVQRYARLIKARGITAE
jgi:tripartite-type tricarboxylate transporter receptor subunit TctC